MKPLKVWLTQRIKNTMAYIVAKPLNHPLLNLYRQAKQTNPPADKAPIQAYSQSSVADVAIWFVDMQQPESTIPLPYTLKFNTITQPEI